MSITRISAATTAGIASAAALVLFALGAANSADSTHAVATSVVADSSGGNLTVNDDGHWG